MRGLHCADGRIHPNAQIWSKGGFREANLPPPPPHPSRLFAQFPLFPKQKAERAAAGGPPPPPLFGGKTPLFGLSATVAAKGGEGGGSAPGTQSPRPRRGPADGGGAEPADVRGRTSPRAPPGPVPRRTDTRGCARIGGEGGEGAGAHASALGQTDARACARFHVRSCTRLRAPFPPPHFHAHTPHVLPPRPALPPPAHPRRALHQAPPPAPPPLPLHQWAPLRALPRAPPRTAS